MGIKIRISHFLAVAVALIISAGQVHATAPANDSFTNATVVTGTNITINGSNLNASTEPGEPTGSSLNPYRASVWYKWTAPATGAVYFSGDTENDFNAVAQIYHGTAVNALTPGLMLPDQSYAVWAGDTVMIEVCSQGTGSGSFTLNISLIPPVPASSNDLLYNSAQITGTNYHFSGSIYGATIEAAEMNPPISYYNGNGWETLWWHYTAPANGNFYPTVSKAQFKSVVRVFEPAGGGNSYTEVATKDGWFFQMQAYHSYYIQLSATNVFSGNFTLDTSFYTEPNDNFSQGTVLTGTNVTVSGEFGSATKEAGEPLEGAANTVWFTWTAPNNGDVHCSMAAKPNPQYCFVYTGSTVSALTKVASGTFGASFMATAGTVYHFQLSGSWDLFDFTLQFSALQRCANDNFADATVLLGNIIALTNSVVGATMEPGEPVHIPGVAQGSVWWKWSAPVSGTFVMAIEANFIGSATPGATLAIYQGDAVDQLTLVVKTASGTSFTVEAGKTYYFAGVVGTNVIGEVAVIGTYQLISGAAPTDPNNLLCEASWEGTSVSNAICWHSDHALSGYVNEPDGADGTTWPVLSGAQNVWQDISTIPGHLYAIRFAYLIGGDLSLGTNDVQVRVAWASNVVGTATLPAAEDGFWHWATFNVIASNTTARVNFENFIGTNHSVNRSVEMDAFSVVDETSPPQIINQPSAASILAGGSVAFSIGTSGSSPLVWRWFLNGTPVSGATNHFLYLTGVTTNQAGTYLAVVTNLFGSATSAPIVLTVQNPLSATILLEPYGDTVPVGGFYNFSVLAAGPPPLTYQWYFNNAAVAGATNRNLVLPNAQATDAGSYKVLVQSSAGSVMSLSATLVIDNSAVGGGEIYFFNRIQGAASPYRAIFDVDGVTPLAGSNYVAQLYAGPSLASLRPAGAPSRFLTGPNAGLFVSQTVTLANVPPLANAVVQVRAWDATMGTSYEEARVSGGRVGQSILFTVSTGGGVPGSFPQLPALLTDLNSFSLQAGLPYYTVGVIHWVGRQPDGSLVWSHQGQVGSIYLIESSDHHFNWQPFLILTNTVATVNFTNYPDTNTHGFFLRSRILD